MRRTIYIPVIVLLLTFGVSNGQTADEHLERGKVALMKKSYQTAYEHLTKSIELDSTSPESFYYRGLLLLYNGNYHASIMDLNKAIEMQNDFADSYNNRGLAFSFIDDPDMAYLDFSKAIKLDPKFTEAYINRASLYMNVAKYDSAMMDFKKAEKLSPKNPELAYQKGRLFYKMEKFPDAIKEFTNAIKNGLSKNPKIYYNRGNAYVRSENYQKAIEDYSETLKLDTMDLEALTNRAYSYDRLGETELAENDRIRIEQIKAIMYPPVDVKAYKPISDTKNIINFEIPENWLHWVRYQEKTTNIIVSKDSLNPDSDPLIYGLSASLTEDFPEGTDLSNDDAVLKYWYNEQVASTASFEKYNILSQKNMRYKGWSGYNNIVHVQFAKGYIPFIIDEFVITTQKKVFYVYFQVPQTEYERYKHIFEHIKTSISINLENIGK